MFLELVWYAMSHSTFYEHTLSTISILNLSYDNPYIIYFKPILYSYSKYSAEKVNISWQQIRWKGFIGKECKFDKLINSG